MLRCSFRWEREREREFYLPQLRDAVLGPKQQHEKQQQHQPNEQKKGKHFSSNIFLTFSSSIKSSLCDSKLIPRESHFHVSFTQARAFTFLSFIRNVCICVRVAFTSNLADVNVLSCTLLPLFHSFILFGVSISSLSFMDENDSNTL